MVAIVDSIRMVVAAEKEVDGGVGWGWQLNMMLNRGWLMCCSIGGVFYYMR